MRARAALVLLAGILLPLGAGCAGSKGASFRIGILSDCYGAFSSTHEVIVASAELPLLARGGKLRGNKPSDGIEATRVAGRTVELLVGCVGDTEDVLPQARRLVEEDGARVVVGPLFPQEGLVLRDYAQRRPETVFLIQPSDAPELTLSTPAPNVFRFVPDAAQSVAGLGSYAYHELGWRTAMTIGDDVPYGWANVSGFLAEFCALGGRVLERRWVPVGADPATTVAQIPASIDGVYLGTALAPVLGFLRRYSALHRDFAKRLLSSASVVYDPQVVALAHGLIVGGSIPLEPTPAVSAYVAAFVKAFPRIPAAGALDPLTVPYRDGVEAALEALERAVGRGQSFRDALAQIELDSPAGLFHLDRNRQAVVPSYLSRIVAGAGGRPAIRTLRVVPNVEQTFGGYFKATDPPPSETSPACVRRTPPRWAR
jgi:branched-chain amino acid transport system substrate-binding protein